MASQCPKWMAQKDGTVQGMLQLRILLFPSDMDDKNRLSCVYAQHLEQPACASSGQLVQH